MKSYYTISFLFLLAMVLGKNVLDLEKLKQGLEGEQNDKREPKNVFKGFDGKLIGKRDGKNVFNLKFDHHDKRDQTTFSLHENLLQSIIPQVLEISVFGGYVRDNSEISDLTEQKDSSLLVIAPSDKAIFDKLGGYKPWEFPESVDKAENDEEEAKIIDSNIKLFLYSHIVSSFGTMKDEDFKLVNDHEFITTLMSGKEITIKQSSATGSFSLVYENNPVPVQSIREVDNGYLFIIDDVLSKPSQ